MTRDEMMEAVDKLVVYQKDYETLLLLLNNADDRFFIKVLESIFNGELYLEDFERMFSDDAYANILEQNFKTQQALRREVARLLEYRNNILGEVDYTIDNIQGKLALIKSTVPPVIVAGENDYNTTDNYKEFYNTAAGEVRADLIYQLLYSSEKDPYIVREAKLKLLEQFTDPTSGITEDDLLLFTDSLIIPLSYNYQVLNQSDNEFMLENRITEQEMKKIKALSIFLRTKNEGGV